MLAAVVSALSVIVAVVGLGFGIAAFVKQNNASTPRSSSGSIAIQACAGINFTDPCVVPGQTLFCNDTFLAYMCQSDAMSEEPMWCAKGAVGSGGSTPAYLAGVCPPPSGQCTSLTNNWLFFCGDQSPQEEIGRIYLCDNSVWSRFSTANPFFNVEEEVIEERNTLSVRAQFPGAGSDPTLMTVNYTLTTFNYPGANFRTLYLLLGPTDGQYSYIKTSTRPTETVFFFENLGPILAGIATTMTTNDIDSVPITNVPLSSQIRPSLQPLGGAFITSWIDSAFVIGNRYNFSISEPVPYFVRFESVPLSPS